MIDQFFEVSCEIEFSPEHYSDYCVLVPVSVIFRIWSNGGSSVGNHRRTPSLLSFIVSWNSLVRKTWAVQSGVLASVILVKDEDSNSSRSLDHQTGFPADLSYGAMFGVLIGL